MSELKAALEAELCLEASDLRSHAWYHGTIPRQRAEELIAVEGSFLVRDCISQPGDYVISCRWKGSPLHFVIKKVITNSSTLYERVEYFFEKELFASIPDFITYYVGSKCPLSEASGAIISQPVNRTMPLTYYATRYGIQCQMHNAAKKLEMFQVSDHTQSLHPAKLNISPSHSLKIPGSPVMSNTLTRVGSDPLISPNVNENKLHTRPNSGSFFSDITLFSSKGDEPPPPKPSRVPSKKYAHKPIACKHSSPIHEKRHVPPSFKKQLSETRFSFLDRKSDDDTLTVPLLNPPLPFQPQVFKSMLISAQNLPLEEKVLNEVKRLLLCTPANVLAAHMAKKDLEVAHILDKADLGLGVFCGLELLLLPQGKQLQRNLLERAECLKLFVAVTLLTSPQIHMRIQLLSKWIDVAAEIKKSFGDLYGFACILMGLTLPEIQALSSTWLALRHQCTELALTFETKLRPAFRNLQLGTGLEAPNTSFPYLLSLISILDKYIEVVDLLEENAFSSDVVIRDITSLEVFGENTSDYGLQSLADQLEIGRHVTQCHAAYMQNGELLLKAVEYDNTLIDLFSTEFHQRLLWGSRGCVVCQQERFQKFQKVLTLLCNKCNELAACQRKWNQTCM